MVAFLDKSTGSAGFHQIIDFLNRSHICYALTKKPEVCVSFLKQFWRSAEASTDDHGEVTINATIDGHLLSITQGSLRRHLKLADQDGITSLPNSEIFEQLALMGYHTDSDKLTFQNGAFSPQWRFLIHNILHCLSPKKTAWEQFSSNIATALISSLSATNRKYAETPTSTSHSPEPSTSHSPEPSTQHSLDNTTATASQPSPTQPSPTHPSPRAEHHVPTPHDSPLHVVHSYGSDEGIGALEADLTKKKTYSSALYKLILQVTPTKVHSRSRGSEKAGDDVSTTVKRKKQKSPEKSPEKSAEKMEEDDVSKETRAKRKKSIPRKSTRKRQKLEEDAEKEELKGFLDIIPREEVPMEVESISIKDGQKKNVSKHKVLSEMLEDFDRQDVEELYRLVKERYSASRLEGFDLMLWGDLYTLFESDEEDEIWKSGSPRRQETIGGTPAQTRSERVLEKPNEPPLSEGHTFGSRKGRMEHQFELTANVPIIPHDSPLPGGYTPGSDKGRLKL
ncbi:hypothetical protein Tco_0381655 [Tanacetum coccineum]